MNEIILNSHNKSLIRKKRFWNISLIALLLIGITLSSKIIDINSSNLLNGIPRLGDYVSQILPSLETSNLFLSSKDKGSIAYWYFNLPKYLKLLFETFNMALLATIIGSTLALFLSFLAAKNTSPNSLVFFTIRRILEFFRGVPEIIFAILFVWVLGIGPLAGIIAMTLHTTGSLGKLFSEVHENSNNKPIDALKASGGNWLSEMKFGLLPQVLPNLISYVLLRFEINIRASTILGFVGAGGIGQELYLVINFNYYEEVSAIILLIILTVVSIDLFSGCGGLSLGLKWAGIETVLANDIDFNCQKTYEFNFPESQFLLGDLSEFQKKDFDKYITNRPDFVVGGPPCQGFSLANKNRNKIKDDPRNKLFYQFLKVINWYSPKVFLMENVKGLLSMKQGKVIETILEEFKNAGKYGYDIDFEVLKASDYGVPQGRERVIVIGFSKDLDLLPEFPKKLALEQK